MTAVSLSETETHLNQCADDRSQWDLFTDDPVWIRRIEKFGIEPIKAVGAGFVYRLNSDQVVIRRGKRKMSEASRQAAALRLSAYGGAGGKST